MLFHQEKCFRSTDKRELNAPLFPYARDVNSNRLKCDRVHKLSIMKWRINHGVITDYSSYHRQMFYSRLSNIVYHPIVTTNISHAYLHY